MQCIAGNQSVNLARQQIRMASIGEGICQMVMPPLATDEDHAENSAVCELVNLKGEAMHLIGEWETAAPQSAAPDIYRACAQQLRLACFPGLNNPLEGDG
jgi:hypothetical protein